MLFTGVILAAGATLGILTEIDGIDSFSGEPETQEDKNVTNIEAVAVFAGALLTTGALLLDQQQDKQENSN